MNLFAIVPTLLAPFVLGTFSFAAERLYWDAADAPGLQAGNGSWSAEAKNWSASADGSGPRVGWRAGAVAVFNSPDKQLVLVGAPVEVSGIEGKAVDIAGGTILFPAAGLAIATDGEVILSSAVRGEGPVLKHGKGILSLGGVNTLPGGFTLTAGKLRFFTPVALGEGPLRVEATASLVPASANMTMGNAVAIKAGAHLVIECDSPEFTLSGPISGGGEVEKAGRGSLVLSGLFDASVRLLGSQGVLDFRPPEPVKLDATIKGGLLRAAAGSLAEGTKLLITQAGALAASGARDGVQAWVKSGWIAPESNGTLAWDGKEEVGGTIDLKPFAIKYPSMSLGACGKIIVTGRLELPGSVLRIGGGGGDVEIRTPLTGPLQLIVGAPSSSGNVTLSAENTFTGGLRIDGGTLRVGHARAIPAGEIRMGNPLAGMVNCQLDLNNFDLPNAVKLEGAVTIKNSGGKASTLSGAIVAGAFRHRYLAGNGSSLRVTGTLSCTEIVSISSDTPAPAGRANVVEFAPATPNSNTAKRIHVEGGTVFRAVDGTGLPAKARLVLYCGIFESHGEFSRQLLPLNGSRDDEGGISFAWGSYVGGGFSAHGGPLTVRLNGGTPFAWGTQADGSLKPGNCLLVLNAPSADSLLTLDVPLDLAGGEVDRKSVPTPLHRIAVHAAEAVINQPIRSSGSKPAGILKLGSGMLTLNAANSYTDKTVVSEGALAFGSPAAIAGSGRSIIPENGSVVAANFPIDNAFLQRLASPSSMAFTVALGANSSAPLDFNSNTGAILRGATLGATKEAAFSGTLTPCDKLTRLGGGGGTLVVKNPAIIPSVIGGSMSPGRVVLPEGLPEGTSLPKDFVLLDGSLTIGSKPYEAPQFSRSITPTPVPAEPPVLTASASDRWVDAAWTFPVNPKGGFAVEWSKNGKDFESAGTAWPEERRFPIFLINPPKTWLGAPGEVFVRVAAIDGEGKPGAWSTVAKTTCAERFDAEKQIPAMFAGSADQRKYNANDPERLVTYSPGEKEAQRKRGGGLAAQLKALSNSADREFVIAPGTYRVKTRQLAVEGAKNLTIRAHGVEIIVDDEQSGAIFSFTDCDGILLTGRAAAGKDSIKEPGNWEKLTALFGSKPAQLVAEPDPLVIDSEQLAFSLGRIVGVNTAEATVDIEVLPGYDTTLPESERVIAYSPEGRMLNIMQIKWEAYQDLGGRKLRLSLPSLREPRLQNASIKSGNLLVLHISTSHRTRTHHLTSTQNCGNMTYESVRFVNGGGAPADNRTAGHTIYRDWRNSPRAGTNRLEICAGLGQFSKEGGTFLFENCEFGPHLDDGINLLSGIGLAVRQTGANSILVSGKEPTPGQTLTFYDFYSWDKLCEAKIVSAKVLTEPETTQAGSSWCEYNHLTNFAMRGLWSVVLETPVRLRPFAPVVFSDHRCDNITVRGCLFRDQMSDILCLKGATSGLIENNLLLRSTGAAVDMVFSQFWWEGPQPSNFIIRNNTILNSPVWFPPSSKCGGLGAISIWAEVAQHAGSEPVTERLFSGFRIEGNTIINPGAQGVLLRNTRNAVVRYNKIVHPGAVEFITPASAIALDQVSEAVVSDNEIILGNGSAPEAVSLLGGCESKTIQIKNNTLRRN